MFSPKHLVQCATLIAPYDILYFANLALML
jgi:hypothetical protein